MALLHGQVHGLLAKCDLVFLPVSLEERTERRAGKDARRYYCNYSEYAAVVTRCAEQVDRARLLCPLLLGRYGDESRAMDGKHGEWATLKGSAALVSAIEKALSIRAAPPSTRPIRGGTAPRPGR
jgi:hypothetical protein